MVSYQVVLLDSLGSHFLKKPTTDSLMLLAEVLPPEFFPGLREMVKDVHDNNRLSEVIDLYTHYFEVPSHCSLTSHQSATVFGYKRPEFLDPILASLGVEYKPLGNKMPDHVGNLILILAIIVKNIEDAESEDVLKNQRNLLDKFIKMHIFTFVDRLNKELGTCHCNDEINVYKILMKGIEPLVKTIRTNIRTI